MKGIIFTELVRFMEHVKSAKFVDDVITAAKLPNDGAFTSVGNYPSEYALSMVGEASKVSGIDAAELCRLFGHYLYNRFLILYPDIIGAYTNAENLLAHVGSHIHEEVRILYPDARPPHIESKNSGDGFELLYQSHRPMAAIACGLVQGCMEHFKDDRELTWHFSDGGKRASFIIKDKINA